jgi:hypothetical protein
MLLRAGHIEELKMNLDSITTLQEIERFYRKKKKVFLILYQKKNFTDIRKMMFRYGFQCMFKNDKKEKKYELSKSSVKNDCTIKMY